MSNMDVLLQTEASEMGGFEMLDGPPETEVEPKRPWIRPELMQNSINFCSISSETFHGAFQAAIPLERP